MNFYYDDQNGRYHFQRRRTPSWFALIVAVLVAAIIGGMIGVYLGPYLLGKSVPYIADKSGSVPPQNIEIVTDAEDLKVIPTVAKKAMPSVVGITTVTEQRDFFFGIRRGEGVGTGVIVDANGFILTNSHVVNDGQVAEVKVLLYDGNTLRADVLWNDSLLDLAVLKVNAKNLPVASLGNSDEMEVGDLAIAIGNPLGLAFQRTVTSGIISGLDRSVPVGEFESIDGLIQTDASINPGNSGGPLLNAKGEVIGINTAKIQTGEGLGFAIPINIAKPIVDEFIEKGEFTKVYLGIQGISTAQYVQAYGDNLGTTEGVLAYRVSPNSPAYKAGMQDGDVILSVDGKKVDNMRQLSRQLYEYRPGDEAELEIMRRGQKMKLRVVFEAATQSN